MNKKVQTSGNTLPRTHIAPPDYRWNPDAQQWEFHEPAWGGWCVLRSTPAETSRPMTYAEGFWHLELKGRDDILNPLVPGRPPR